MTKTSQAQEHKGKSANTTAKVTRETVLDSLFDDMYKKRWRVYLYNFGRGVFFGIGSALGGTVILALIVWASSWLIDWAGLSEAVSNYLNHALNR